MLPLPLILLGWLAVPRPETYAPAHLRLAGLAAGWLLPLIVGLTALHQLRDQLPAMVPIAFHGAVGAVGLFPFALKISAIRSAIVLPWILASLFYHPIEWAGCLGTAAAASLGAPKPYLIETVVSPLLFIGPAAAVISGLAMARAWFFPSVWIDASAVLIIHNLIQFGYHTVLPGIAIKRG